MASSIARCNHYLDRARQFLDDGGIVYLYCLFFAGYFVLPMMSGHRRFYFIVVFPAVILLWRELLEFYRGNALLSWVLAYVLYFNSTLLWSSNFNLASALWVVWNSINLLSFVLISGYIFAKWPDWSDSLLNYCLILVAAAALLSMVVWYTVHPFPISRLEPLGVMHHPNKSGAAYGFFVVLAMSRLQKADDQNRKILYCVIAVTIVALVLLTQSRTAMAGVCLSLAVMMGYRILALLGLALTVSWSLLAANSQAWQYRVEMLSFRPGIWESVVSNMDGHWLAGWGYLAETKVAAYSQVFDHAHNSYLSSLRDGGLIGLSVLVCMLGIALVWAWRLLAQSGERLYFAGMLYAITCISMDFDRLLVYPKELWIFFWLPIALILGVYKNNLSTQRGR